MGQKTSSDVSETQYLSATTPARRSKQGYSYPHPQSLPNIPLSDPRQDTWRSPPEGHPSSLPHHPSSFQRLLFNPLDRLHFRNSFHHILFHFLPKEHLVPGSHGLGTRLVVEKRSSSDTHIFLNVPSLYTYSFKEVPSTDYHSFAKEQAPGPCWPWPWRSAPGRSAVPAPNPFYI